MLPTNTHNFGVVDSLGCAIILLGNGNVPHSSKKKAQAEIDAVVGSSRLPDFSDRRSLPYINALVNESMRWQSILPLGKLYPWISKLAHV